ncbi:MAG: hypothetical protein U0470_02280 [Anaerolineae bacterium]
MTNAEWSLFEAAGGYDEDRWWDTPDARSWRRGALTAEGAGAGCRTGWPECGAIRP